MAPAEQVQELYERFKAETGDPQAAASLTLACAHFAATEKPKDILTVSETAKLLGISDGTVYDLCASGRLPHQRLGPRDGTIRILRADVSKLWERGKRPRGRPRNAEFSLPA